jgi:Carboxypeptidase regulatory-like domain/TonB dependent receptor
VIAGFKSVFLILLMTPFCFGQRQGGSLQGQVRDQLGGVIVRAAITLTSSSFHGAIQTDRQGNFAFSGLAPGRYSLRATADGFLPYESKTIDVTTETRVLSIELRVAGQSEQVTVSADMRLAIDADNSATMLVLRGPTLDALPEGIGGLTAALQLLTARAGNPRGPQIFVNGFSDGRIPPKKSIREIRINQNAFSAQYDQPGLGRVEILTKPGTDTIQGGLYSSFNDASMNSRNPFAPERLDSQSRSYGANLSGPVIPRHASFFADFDRAENHDNGVINATVLDEKLNVIPFNRSVLIPQSRSSIGPRLDLRINERHTLVIRYAFSGARMNNQGIGDFSLPSRAYQFKTRRGTFQLTHSGIYGRTLINETRFQYLMDHTQQTASSGLPVLQVPQAFIGGGSEIGKASDQRNGLEAGNDTMWVAGNHALKMGVRYRHTYLSSVAPSNFAGTYTFAGRFAPQLNADGTVVYGPDREPVIIPITTLESYRRTLLFQRQGLSAAEIRQLGGGPAQFSIAAGKASETVKQSDLGIYWQDDWQVVPNLTLSAGLRYEQQTHIEHHDFAPRIGFAWTPSTSKDAKLVVRAGSGFFYDRVGENLVLQSRRFNGINQQQYVVSDPAVLAQFPAVPAVETLSSFALAPAVTRLSDTLRAPYLMQTNFGLERALSSSINASANYVYSRSLHVLRSRNVNAPLLATNSLPIPSLGPIFQYESSGSSRQDQLILNATQRFGRLTYYGTYIFSRAFSDTEGPSSFPASSYNLATDWGRSLQDVRHTFYWGGWITGPLRLDIIPTVVMRSGVPFNITTGLDTDGDTLFTERPAFATSNSSNVVTTPFGRFDLSPMPGQPFIPRNFGRGSRFVATHLKIGRSFNVTPPSNSPSPARHNASLTFTVQIQNLFNQTNPDVPAGNLSSPLFGRPYSSVGDFGFGNNPGGNRRIEAQIYFGF